MQATYRVGGMTCGGCVSSVEKALQQALPTAEIDVSLEGGTATVEGDHEPSAVQQAIEAAGFELEN